MVGDLFCSEVCRAVAGDADTNEEKLGARGDASNISIASTFVEKTDVVLDFYIQFLLIGIIDASDLGTTKYLDIDASLMTFDIKPFASTVVDTRCAPVWALVVNRIVWCCFDISRQWAGNVSV